MLQVPLIFALLNSIVVYCRDEGKDETKHLCSSGLLKQIAHVEKLLSLGENGAKALLQLKTVRICNIAVASFARVCRHELI